MVVKIASDLGITVGAGVEDITGNNKHTDKTNITAYALYTMGPVSIGYQEDYLDQGSGTGNVDISAGGDYTGNAMGIAFNVNDNLSLSYGEINETLEAQSGTLAADRDVTSITAAYSAGGMALTIQQTDTDNFAMNTTAADAIDTEATQITLAFAF